VKGHILFCTETSVPALPSHRGPGKMGFLSKRCAGVLSGYEDVLLDDGL
jgi:hypothetical protein